MSDRDATNSAVPANARRWAVVPLLMAVLIAAAVAMQGTLGTVGVLVVAVLGIAAMSFAVRMAVKPRQV